MRVISRLCWSGLILPACLFSCLVMAGETKFSGYATAAVGITDNEEDYLLSRYSDEANYGSDSVFGLMVSNELNERVVISGQLVAQNDSDFDAEAEWLFITYNLTPNLTFRAGRLRTPIYFASQHIHVSSSYLWFKPPAEVYNQAPFTRYHGFDVSHRTQLEDTSIDIQFYSGKIDDDLQFFGAVLNGESKEVYGTNIIAEGDFYKARLTYIDSNFRINLAQPIEFSVQFISAGYQRELGKWELISEFALRKTDQELIGDTVGGYITLARSFGDTTPYATVGFIDTDDVTENLQLDSQSVSLGVRYDDSYGLTWKAEVHRGKADSGTAGLTTDAVVPVDPKTNLLRLSVSTVF